MSRASWMKNTTVGKFFDLQTAQMPDQKALLTPQTGDYTFRELKEVSDRVARGLMALGIKRAHRVAVWAHNIPEWVFLYLALAKIGAVMVPLNPNIRARDFRYDLQTAEVNYLFLVGACNGSDLLEIMRYSIPDLELLSGGRVHSTEFPHLRMIVTLGDSVTAEFPTFSQVLENAHQISDSELRARIATVSPQDTFIIKFTCGLTGYSRGAMLTHFGLVNNAIPMARKFNFGPSDTICLPVPLHYIFGFWVGLMVGMVAHTPVAIPPRYSALEVLKLIEEKRCTALYGVPAMFGDLIEHPEFANTNLKSLRTGLISGEYCPPDLVKRAIEAIPIPELTQGYGITEIGLLTQTSWQEAKEKAPCSVGQALEGMQMKIIDAQSGSSLPPGEVGEICVRSPVMMKGYYHMPNETAEVIDAEGWFHTGDLGTQDKNGYYRITGRRRNMLIRGGENIYLMEVERFLQTCPEVAEVKVVGVPSRRLGEEAYAFVKTKNAATVTPQSLRDYFRNQVCRHHIPRWINVVKEMPADACGRVDRNELRRVAMRDLKLDDPPLQILYE